jgi:hypothetical protein
MGWRCCWVLAVALAAGCGGAGGEREVAAEAAGQILLRESLAEWTSRVPSGRPTERDASFVALIWVDYTLLAHAASQPDALLDTALVAAALAPDAMLLRLRKWHDTLVARRPAPAPAVVESLFADPDFRVFQHVFVRVTDPTDGRRLTEARQRVDSILARARAGEDFAALARSRSDDPSGLQGGYLPPGRRGTFSREFERDVWSLPVGAVGGAVTAAGFHVVRRPPLAEVRGHIMEYARAVATQRADSIYLDSLTRARRLTVAKSAARLLRAYFDDPAGAGDGILASWLGDSLMLRQVVTWVDLLQPGPQLDLRGASTRRLEQYVLEIARQVLMDHEATAAGVRVTAADWNDLQAGYRRALREALALLGVGDPTTVIPPGEGPGRVAAAVDAMTRDRVRWRPLPGALAAELRRRYGYRLHRRGIAAAAEAARALVDP